MVTPGSKLASPIRFRVAHKLGLIVLTLLVSVGVLTYLLFSTYRKLGDFDRQELEGLDMIRPLLGIIKATQERRGLANGLLNGDKSLKADIAKRDGEIETGIRQFIEAEKGLRTNIRAPKKWTEVVDAWKGFQAGWQDIKAKTPQLKPEESFEQHTKLVQQLVDMVAGIGEVSNLILDPALEPYFLQDVLTSRTSVFGETTGQLRGLGTSVLARKSLGEDDVEALYTLLGRLALTRQELVDDVSGAIRTDESHREILGPVLKELEDATDELNKTVAQKIVKTKKLELSPVEFYDLATKPNDANFRLTSLIEPLLRELLNKRLAELEANTRIAYASLAVGLALALGIVFLIARGIARQISEIRRMFTQIGKGDFTARAQVVTQDELGQMARAVNDEVLPLVQSHEDRERLQHSITKLLEEVSGVAEGDLTREAEVTADATGAIADSFNYMTDQLRKIISNVQSSTQQVSTSATRIYATTDVLAKGSEAQAHQIVATSAAVDEMATSIQRVSADAATSAAVAQQALLSARKGNEAVKTTIRGMNRIRKQVQETAKRIKRLGESSQEIGQIIQLINEISERTSILALNASIQASMAGEAGRGFAVVAEEVERLAVRSTDATRKIGSLVKTIQTETGEAVTAMEKGIGEVVDGSQLANQAGQALVEIETVSNQLAELINSISQASKQQAQGSEAVAKSMAQIAQFTRRTAAGTREAAGAVSSLTALAANLRASVSTFRLPAGQGTLPEPVAPAGLGNGLTPHHAPPSRELAEPAEIAV